MNKASVIGRVRTKKKKKINSTSVCSHTATLERYYLREGNMTIVALLNQLLYNTIIGRHRSKFDDFESKFCTAYNTITHQIL